ncbi:conserved exported hypothetical protein [Verrucomicrobia bacterium]|nr:conserved exported hypothetical protein [Verrucomicrobiota bacterium]
MNVVWSKGFKRLWLLAALWGWAQGAAYAQTYLAADEIMQRAVARTEHAAARPEQTGYSFTKLTVTEQLDAAGNVKERKERVYQVWVRGGSTYGKLVEVNGHPPAPAESKLQAENEQNVRMVVGTSKSGKGDNRENFLTPEIAAHFNFTLAGQEPINGRLAYRLQFQPKDPTAPAHRIVDRLLNRISGTLWIDAEEFEIAHAELHLGSEVDVLGGVIGSLRKLAYTLTRTRLADGIWLNTFSSGDFEGRKLLESLRFRTKSRATDFRPLGVPS